MSGTHQKSYVNPLQTDVQAQLQTKTPQVPNMPATIMSLTIRCSAIMWLTWDKQIIPKMALLFGYSVKSKVMGNYMYYDGYH